MHALVLAAMNEPMSYVERPDLTVGPGEVLVAIKAAALNRRDFWITQGMYPGVKMPVVSVSAGPGIRVVCAPFAQEAGSGRPLTASTRKLRKRQRLLPASKHISLLS